MMIRMIQKTRLSIKPDTDSKDEDDEDDNDRDSS
jgi:hypothetical protein